MVQKEMEREFHGSPDPWVKRVTFVTQPDVGRGRKPPLTTSQNPTEPTSVNRVVSRLSKGAVPHGPIQGSDVTASTRPLAAGVRGELTPRTLTARFSGMTGLCERLGSPDPWYFTSNEITGLDDSQTRDVDYGAVTIGR